MLDKANARLVTVGLVLITLGAIVATVVLSLADKAVPSELSGLIPVGFGAIAALSTVRAAQPEGTELTALAEPIRYSVTGTGVTSDTPGSAVIVETKS